MLEKKRNEIITIGSNEIEVMFTNIDGMIPRPLELTDYLKE